MICTVGLNPTPVALAVLTSKPRPDDVLLVCSTASQPVADRLIEVLGALLPDTAFRSFPVGSGASWRATYAALVGEMPEPPYLLDYTGGTTSMTMAAVKLHLEDHESVAAGGASLRSYIDEQSGEQVYDSGAATGVDTAVLTINLLALLHCIELSLDTVLGKPKLILPQDKQLVETFVDATRSAVQKQAITDEWEAAWCGIGLGEVFARLRPTPEATKSEREGVFVELVSLAAAIASGCCEEIAFDVEAREDAQDDVISQFDVIARSGHRVVCIESKKGYLDTRDDLGHRMSTALKVFGGAARVQIHLLSTPDNQLPLTAYEQEVNSWKHAIPELDRVHLIHTFSKPSAADLRGHSASRSTGRGVDPLGAMIERLRLDLPAPSPAIGRSVPDQGVLPMTKPEFGTVMVAVGGSPILNGLILDNESRTVHVAGPRQTTQRVTAGSAVELADTTNLSAHAVWRAAWTKQPEAVLPTSSKKSAAAGLLRYAHESGAAIEHLLPRGEREFGNGITSPLSVPPRWHALLTDPGRRRAQGPRGLYQPYGTDGAVWQPDTLIERVVLQDLAARWSGVDGVAVFLATDIGVRATAPVIVTHRFHAFAVGSPFGGNTIKWPLARSLTALQATVLNARFGPAVRTWVALTDRARDECDATQRDRWFALWDRLHMLSGVEEGDLAGAPWTAADLDAEIARYLGTAPPELA